MRPPPEHAVLAFAALADRLHLRWYVFGAQAVNLHGFPRTTADLDVTLDLGDHDLPELRVALRRAGFDTREADDAFVLATRVLPVVHRATGLPVDLVLAGPGLEQIFLDEVDTWTIRRRKVCVLSVENLVVTKLLAGRPRDVEDVRELVARRDDLDHAKVERLLELLEDALERSDLRSLYASLRTDRR